MLLTFTLYQCLSVSQLHSENYLRCLYTIFSNLESNKYRYIFINEYPYIAVDATPGGCTKY